ncbi:TIGR04197 family type VII secretion effector [Enterococcus sp. BWM-S5]|uniref:TIGR04197 family type VII secretion effector n=1 Tax=Enterococcus larvae TaxID=2794352 RepID=A0ABS4CJ85_9ENTE|nr:TIGR04197 family type VII secretion effector [Enterococcus larvae]MBP1046683.1 TIGR04197 family type VII secretion effector [Enterococcus larvae]
MSVRSNEEVAKQYATEIASALDLLSDCSDPELDSKTTVSGNDNAHQSFEKEKATIEAICSVISTDSKNFHSIAKEFKAMDERIYEGIAPAKDWW